MTALTALAVTLYVLIACGVARAEADRRSALRYRSIWFNAVAIGALWPAMAVVALASRGWKAAGEWL